MTLLLEDLAQRRDRLAARMDDMRDYFDLEHRQRQLTELETAAAAPDFWNDTARARETLARANRLRSVLNAWREARQAVDDAAIYVEMASTETAETARQAAIAEGNALLDRAETILNDLEIRSLLSGRFDERNCYLELHAGAGGTESCDWAAMLLRMFSRYAERNGFAVEVLDVQPGDEAGIKSASLFVSGPYAYGYFKSERGVHRLVRISPFDANRRRHTSFAALDVVAELDDDVEIEIQDKDLRIDTYRSGGAGGQHVNKTDSAVRIVHLPTGIVVACQAERSQHANRERAMRMLKARLYEMEMDRKRREMEQFYGEKGEIAWGRQIRSYVLQPYQMVKDHRTDVEVGRVDAVLDGDLRPFVDAYLRKFRPRDGDGM
ncbi:MAG: peptide chain release factor 2 [Kiritimatiellae bacterium]|nr:peptide chain release factor 2 [Kiritimatiellia bacterium]